MYRDTLKQMEFEDFTLPFGGKLRSDNRWVILSKRIPWEEVEFLYTKSLAGTGMGSPAKSARVALGALIIKERLGVSDEEAVNQIQENPYLQFFLGFNEYRDEPPFNPSMYVHFRKRFDGDILSQVNEIIAKKALQKKKKGDDDTDSSPSNKGKLLVDATCAPADITYPTDMKLLNDAREKTESIIDVLHQPLKGREKKPRTYRQKARKGYLQFSKNRNPSVRLIRKAIRKELGYVKRNLKSIDGLISRSDLGLLTKRQYKDLLVISEVYRQQQFMYGSRVRRIDDRIVSISQPHVRPIKRGKASVDTEFGAKISVSLVEGFSFVDHHSWDNFNESNDLIGQIESYRERLGVYPESVHVDRIYRNRDNRRYCKKHNIRISGPPLGRPRKINDSNQSQIRNEKKQTRQDERDRIPIEGKFGQGKRRYGLGRIMSKLPKTSETSVMLTFLVMNLERWLKAIFFAPIFWIECGRKKETGSRLFTFKIHFLKSGSLTHARIC